jgi:hypothetical protein
MAPHRNRLLPVIPPERSQNLAAAGRQGAKSIISIAAADVADRIRRSAAVRRFGFIGWLSIVVVEACRSRLDHAYEDFILEFDMNPRDATS